MICFVLCGNVQLFIHAMQGSHSMSYTTLTCTNTHIPTARDHHVAPELRIHQRHGGPFQQHRKQHHPSQRQRYQQQQQPHHPIHHPSNDSRGNNRRASNTLQPYYGLYDGVFECCIVNFLGNLFFSLYRGRTLCSNIPFYYNYYFLHIFDERLFSSMVFCMHRTTPG